ncbi:uncharacterized protein LOC135822361 [Sycon ciliatum]|uniref:uncharacterized protein LOC135822361 n=1 Tax=Sycon ciliatum TaxID=27933 RepID=UPI0031F6AFD8|eukprot:scpid89076/ scgid12851/ Putative methyltransferase DDB_G0268948
MARYFEDSRSADRYARFRPQYPGCLLDKIKDVVSGRDGGTADKNGHGETASIEDLRVVDVGCGAGGSTFFLAEAGFKEICGVDASQAQINEAKKALEKKDDDVKQRVEFRIVDCNAGLPFDRDSVDVVIVAAAMHWLEPVQFYAHVNDILRAGGYVIAFSYGFSQFQDEDLQRPFDNLSQKTLEKYWEPEIVHTFTHYKHILEPYDTCKRFTLDWNYRVTLSELINFMSSWTAYPIYCGQHPDNTILEDFEKEVRKVLQSRHQHGTTPERNGSADSSDDDPTVEFKFPLFGFAGRRPCMTSTNKLDGCVRLDVVDKAGQ